MAKELTFNCAGKIFSSQPVKLEREKIYGRSEIIVTDPDGKVFTCLKLDAEGTLIVPAGAVNAGQLDESGSRVEKTELSVADENGQTPVKISSSCGPFRGALRVETEIASYDRRAVGGQNDKVMETVLHYLELRDQRKDIQLPQCLFEYQSIERVYA